MRVRLARHCGALSVVVTLFSAVIAHANQPQTPNLSGPLERAYAQHKGDMPALFALRRLQIKAGNSKVLVTHGWPQVGDAVLAMVSRLPEHGVSISAEFSGVVDMLTEHRDALLSHTTWQRIPDDDAQGPRISANAEVLLAQTFVMLAQHLNVTVPQAPETERRVQERLIHALVTWQDTQGLLQTLLPCVTDYEPLMGALKALRDIQAQGGYVALPKNIKRARPGREHEGILALRQRLSQEDRVLKAAPKPENPLVWDDSLTDALRRARAVYQLRSHRSARRLLNRRLRSALAVPVERRIAAVQYSLAQLRRSAFNQFVYAVRINLPEYMGEVWDGPKRVHAFKVVIGAKGYGRRMINRTPVLASRIHTVVYNPGWIPTPRIFKRELLPKAEKWADEGAAVGEVRLPEDYWEKKGFKLMNKDKPEKQWVRQLPGRYNPLGKVKLLFENRYTVYMHDTPARKLFRKARRAASHGCIRLHKPLALVELLLKRDKTWALAEEKKVMSHYKETFISLNSTIPIVIDYVPVRVDKDGRTHFMADVYRQLTVARAGR